MARFTDQVAIVTGGAMGIGGATARRLASGGARVLIADVDVPAGEANAERIRADGGTADVLRTDVGSHADIKAMVGQAVELWGRLDILVNNAWSRHRPQRDGILEMSEEMWDQSMSTLVKSMFLSGKYAVPEMRKSGGGSIVNISSVHGILNAPGWLVYESGKAAVLGLTRQLATELGPWRIRVNAICPGDIVTESAQATWDENPAAQPFFMDQAPLRRQGRPDDIAGAAAFLCSEDASFITGQTLVVDGGLTVQLQVDFGERQARYAIEHPETMS